jgi:hypothetical protein
MIDVRALLPRADWSIGTAPKASVTVHWNGPAVDYEANPLNVAKADAQFHIDKDWSSDGSGAHGDGIMYHRLYAPDGSVLMTRDEDAILWHSNTDEGNLHSAAWQVMTGKGQTPTPEQLASLARDLVGHVRYGHRDWSRTECPGDELYAFIQGDKEEETVEDEEFIEKTTRIITPTLVAMKEAYDPLVAWARENGKLDADQEAAIAKIENALGPDGVKLIVEAQSGVKDEALKPRALGGNE